jgi:membrane fusion protein (multidrug efflux system)
VFTVIALVVVLGLLVVLKGAQFSAMAQSGAEAAKQGPPPETVGTAKTSTAEWEDTIEAVGSVASAKGVTLTSEVPGAVKRIAFESGDLVKRGDVIVELDSSVERAQLASASAERELAQLTAERSSKLATQGSLAKAELDQNKATLAAATASAEGLRAQLAKKTVRAPFDGRLGIREVNLGQYLTPGTPIATLESVEETFVDFSVPQQNLADVHEGTEVRITLGQDAGSRQSITGSVAAIDPSIEPSTRSVQVRARVTDTAGRLRPGMFVGVSVVLPKNERIVAAPATAIVHAPYGDSVFVVEPKKKDAPGMRQTPDGKPVRVVRQQFVRVGRQRGDYVAILEGVEPGQELVTAGAFKLRNGAPVVVSEKAVPAPQLEPHPKNR